MQIHDKEKKRILFVINQFYKGGAEVALLNLFKILPQEKYDIDFLIFDQFPVKNAISLIDDIPGHIHVFNAAEKEGKVSVAKKAVFKIIHKVTRKQMFRQNVYAYLKDKQYDVAISYGEWFSSSLVALHVDAKYKYLWIHADIDKASFVHSDILNYQQCFDKFIFVSEHSKKSAIKKYPILIPKSVVVYNNVDANSIQENSQVEIDFKYEDLPVLITVANVRNEKNHLRQVAVMQELFKRNIKFYWLNIGNFSDSALAQNIKKAASAAGIEQYFKLLGPIENPYAYMKYASAVCVLSDHESWSMVITEAKTLGIPVIATKTSGALEQIVHQETGILCDFSVQSIADEIERFLENTAQQSYIRSQLQNFCIEEHVLQQLTSLLDVDKKRILYLFDDINYTSGARNAMLNQVNVLKDDFDITLFSITPVKDVAIEEQYKIIDLDSNKAFCSLLQPFKEVMQDKTTSLHIKAIRFLYAIAARLQLDEIVYNALLQYGTKVMMESFDVVCVVSEASKLRWTVSKLQYPKKIQWIHTDYAAWQQHNAWTKSVTKKDEQLYSCYDNIVLLSDELKGKFDRKYPKLQHKTVAIPNLIQWETILMKSEEPLNISVDENCFNLITIGRLEPEKQHGKLLQVAKELKEQGLNFHWYFVGDGDLRNLLGRQCDSLNLENVITFTGNLTNPYPLLKQCDLFVLMSEYEGTPVTIDEAKVLDIPVLANDVGGIRDQLDAGCGLLVENMQEMISEIQQRMGIKKKSSNVKVFFSKYNRECLEKIQHLLQ